MYASGSSGSFIGKFDNHQTKKTMRVTSSQVQSKTKYKNSVEPTLESEESIEARNHLAGTLKNFHRRLWRNVMGIEEEDAFVRSELSEYSQASIASAKAGEKMEKLEKRPFQIRSLSQPCFRKIDPPSHEKAKLFRRNTLRRLSSFIPRGIFGQDPGVEETDVAVVRHRPETLRELCRVTKFSKKEIQLMYRGFKQCCPSGLVTLEQFQDIYAQFFPQGDSAKYASFIFNTFDIDKNGHITFNEFVRGLSVLSRGTEDDKLGWVFNLYDVNKDGILTKDDIENIVISMYDMMGANTDPPFDESSVKNHVDLVFQRMDAKKYGFISFAEFLTCCKADEIIRQSLHLFDTIFFVGSSLKSSS